MVFCETGDVETLCGYRRLWCCQELMMPITRDVISAFFREGQNRKILMIFFLVMDRKFAENFHVFHIFHHVLKKSRLKRLEMSLYKKFHFYIFLHFSIINFASWKIRGEMHPSPLKMTSLPIPQRYIYNPTANGRNANTVIVWNGILQGQREVDDFVEFLAKHSTSPLKGYNRKGKPVKTKKQTTDEDKELWYNNFTCYIMLYISFW